MSGREKNLGELIGRFSNFKYFKIFSFLDGEFFFYKDLEGSCFLEIILC